DSLKSVDVLAVEDYGKGLFCDQLSDVIAAARKESIHVIVDPHPTADYRRYQGCSLLTPNRTEAEIASGVKITSDETMNLAADAILSITHADAVVITLDREGAFIKRRDGFAAKVPTRQRKVYDVTGAGDVVMAMLSMAMACNCELHKAVALCNVAGGLEVERFGVTPVTRHEIIDEIRKMMGCRREKILDRKSLKQQVEYLHSQGKSVVFTNGCFDLLHVGHITYLRESRELGDCLVVAVNSDASVQRLKGPLRPIISQQDRATMLASLEFVDYVTIFDEDTPEAVLEALRPDVLIKGGSTPVIIGQKFVESYGGSVRRLDLVEGFSTTDIVKKILELNGKEVERD
ncbi:MAG TPA: D-glycero-beta-D-manno-heptose 1-phosphate adenylyltransferase, partial [Phycisphaerae bacterium]|nr:D-glycero-beta-D-manno-heptose 1-phosphate adenylyltransferase [Phycisphaerae bacterium]